MKFKILIFILLVFVCGCTVKTEIIGPDGDMFIIKSKSDSLVVVKKNGHEMTVDNRGQPNIFQSFLEWVLVKTPDISQVE